MKGDQMPLHGNESCSQKTMACTDIDTFVKENTSLSHGHVRYPLTQQILCHWSSSSKARELESSCILHHESMPISQTLAPIGSTSWPPLATWNVGPFFQRETAIYLLDNYSVHVTPEIQMALYNRGHIAIFFGGGITSDLQGNDTHRPCTPSPEGYLSPTGVKTHAAKAACWAQQSASSHTGWKDIPVLGSLAKHQGPCQHCYEAEFPFKQVR